MNKQLKIEHGVPIPDKCGVGRACTYPWPEMKSGDSVLVACPKDKHPINHRSHILSRAGDWLYRNDPKLKAVSRKINDNGDIRIWFVERDQS